MILPRNSNSLEKRGKIKIAHSINCAKLCDLFNLRYRIRQIKADLIRSAEVKGNSRSFCAHIKIMNYSLYICILLFVKSKSKVKIY